MTKQKSMATNLELVVYRVIIRPLVLVKRSFSLKRTGPRKNFRLSVICKCLWVKQTLAQSMRLV